MNYEIAYYSLSGNTEKLAYGIAKRLPENQAFLTNLQEEEVTLAADVYLVALRHKENFRRLKAGTESKFTLSTH